MQAAYPEFALTTGVDENIESKGKPLKRRAILVLVITLSVLFTAGCSKIQTTTLLAEKWETGQHRTCLYGHKNLYCFQPTQLESLPNQQRFQFTPYLLESKRTELVKQPDTDGGSYETKFTSHTPMDFSLWDCYKTGTGSPAIACDLKQKPTTDEVRAFVKTALNKNSR
jgi:hypothetical protein